MSAYEPMNAALQTGRADSHMVQLISGAGGHNLVSATESDAHVEWERTKVAGAAFVTAVGGGSGAASALQWRFADTTGATVTSSTGAGTGSVACGADADAEAPSVPGQAWGSADGSSAITLTWPASTDNLATNLTYRVYRDGATTPSITLQSASTTTVTATDTGLAPHLSHTYEVTASDGTNASERSVASEPITTDPAEEVYADQFTSLVGWHRQNLSLDTTSGSPAPPSAHAQVSDGRAYGYRNLDQELATACVSARVNVASNATSVILLRSRTAGDDGIARLALSSGRILTARNDVTGTATSTGEFLPFGWHVVELCTTVGTSGRILVLLDGAPIADLTTTLGTTPVGRIQIFDRTPGRTFDARLDDLVVDTGPN